MQFYVLVIAAVLVSHQLFVLPGVMCRTFEFGDQKTYYPPDPHHGTSLSLTLSCLYEGKKRGLKWVQFMDHLNF